MSGGPLPDTDAPVDYAELHCLSNFSFLRGASHPAELIATAHALGYRALALTDECSLAGAVRAHEAVLGLQRQEGTRFKLILGTELSTASTPGAPADEVLKLVLLAPSQRAYRQLCQLITLARRRSRKGEYRLTRVDFQSGLDDCLALWVPAVDRAANEEALQAAWLRERFPGRIWIAIELHRGADDAAHLARWLALSRRLALPAVAAGDVHMHTGSRRTLQDVLTAVRHGCTLDQAGWRLYPNAQRQLRSLAELQRLYPRGLLQESLTIAERCEFSLSQLRYEYPPELVPDGSGAAGHLRALTEAGARKRWPEGVPPGVRALIDKELALIGELHYEHFFLTVHEIVCFARGRGILCQGRGSAANSAVCYALGITEVDPARTELLFERFISRERNEPPDIDVDFEHERREEVIQHIYARYGRERAALAASVICYRTRSAVRDVAHALGFDPEAIGRLARLQTWWDRPGELQKRFAREQLRIEPARLQRLQRLVRELTGFPRHLSQHVGGFVIAGEPLSALVPIENAAMADRTVIQWDKDDLESLGMLKVDVLALGMLTALSRCLGLIEGYRGARPRLQDIPPQDPATFEMICRAETVGVFQIESRAQMSMLPRLQPRCFYDLVIQVAIVRPGPIQGDMVHPYLMRREHPGAVNYPSPALRGVLERTLGVPIFQEQVMQIAVVAAGFTPGEADGLRRAMAAWKRRGGLEPYRERLLAGMAQNGYPAEFAGQIYRQILGFGEYGFPECVVGETRVLDADSGQWRRVDAIFSGRGRITNTFACDEDLKLRKRRVIAVVASGVKPVWRLRTALDHSITASAEHPLLTPNGWRRLGELKAGDHVATVTGNPALQRFRETIAGSDICWARIVQIEPCGDQRTYDLQIERDHSFLANHLIVHNSHAASFALLTYVSAWLKCHQPAAFLAALINSQPMGFYAPAQLVAEARRSGVTVLPVDATVSDWDCTLEHAPGVDDAPALRLGLRLVRGLAEADARRLGRVRAQRAFLSIDELGQRARLSQRALRSLAAAGALRSLSTHRHAAQWQALGVERLPGLIEGLSAREPPTPLPVPTEAQEILADYAHLGLSTGRHPLALLREALARRGIRSRQELHALEDGARVRIGGLVTHMQRPQTAAGVVFASLEDETGIVNVILWPKVFDSQRRCALEASLLVVEGELQKRSGVMHVIARRLYDGSRWLGAMARRSRDFR